jgi:GNAT superfamily N-acetyltransferase
VYYAHLLVHPDCQRQGIGKQIMAAFARKYGHFHQQILVADGKAVHFYRQCGFVRAGESQPMWIYQGNEH